MTLPIDRTTKTTLDANLVNGVTSDAPAVKASNDNVYNTIDELYNYTANLVAGGTLQPYPFAMNRQALINGNFDVWQRGTSSTNPASGSFLADRFLISYSAGGGTLPNVTHSRQSLTPGDFSNAYYYYRISPDGAGSGFTSTSYYGIFQRIEKGTRYLCGLSKKVTVSLWARSNISNKRLGIGMQQTYGSGGTPTALENLTGSAVTLTSTWAKYSFTFTTNTLTGKSFGTNDDDYLQINLYTMWGTGTGTSNLNGATAETFVGSGTIDIAQIQICAGDAALPVQPRTFGEELGLCQRYYEKSYDLVVAPGTSGGSQGFYFNFGNPATFTTLGGALQYKVQKRIVPTVTVYDMVGASGKASSWNGSTQTNGITVTTDQGTEQKCRILVGVTSGNYELYGHYTADAEM